MLRRQILGTSALALPAALLAACSITSNGNVTTLTIDTAKVDQDGTALINAATAVLALPSIAVLLGPNLVVAQVALAGAQSALAAFDSATAGKASVDIDTTSVSKLTHSLVGDVQTIVAAVQPVVPKVTPGALQQRLSDYLLAIQTLIPFVLAAVDLAGNSQAKALKLPMTEAQALKIAAH